MDERVLRLIAELEMSGRRADATALRSALGMPRQGVAGPATGPLPYPGMFPPRSADGRYRYLTNSQQPLRRSNAHGLFREPRFYKPLDPGQLNVHYLAWINALGYGETWLEWV
jgi:hypothetical protein